MDFHQYFIEMEQNINLSVIDQQLIYAIKKISFYASQLSQKIEKLNSINIYNFDFVYKDYNKKTSLI